MDAASQPVTASAADRISTQAQASMAVEDVHSPAVAASAVAADIVVVAEAAVAAETTADAVNDQN